MQYIYKSVSLENFIDQHEELKIEGDWLLGSGNFIEHSITVNKAIEALINHYAADGWEFQRVEEFDPLRFMDTAALFSNNSKLLITSVIFRKVMTQELAEKIAQAAEEERRSKIKNKVTRGQPPVNADHLCPNCNSNVNVKDESCWKCNADFSERSAWRPIPRQK